MENGMKSCEDEMDVIIDELRKDKTWGGLSVSMLALFEMHQRSPVVQDYSSIHAVCILLFFSEMGQDEVGDSEVIVSRMVNKLETVMRPILRSKDKC